MILKVLRRLIMIGLVSFSCLNCACSNKQEVSNVEEDANISENLENSISEEYEAETSESNDADNQSIWDYVYGLDMASLYKQIKSVDNPKDFEGSWQATNCHSSLSGSIDITNQTNEGFHYEGFFSYYSHCGEAIGEAHWVSESMAISSQDDVEDSMDDGYMIFYMVGNSLYVRADTFFGSMGMNVTPNNEYTLGEPVYTNADMVNRAYTEEELQQIKDLLGNDLYDDFFIFGTENGGVNVSETMLADDTPCKYVECYMLTWGESYMAVITADGRIYIKVYKYDNEKLYTNDSSWANQELPEVIEQ